MESRQKPNAQNKPKLNNVGNIKTYNEFTKKYEIVKPIDEGGFGTVFVVKTKSKNRYLAAKFIPLNADYQKYIETEIQILQQQNHMNIMKLADDIYIRQSLSPDEKDKVIIISELDEESLDTFIKSKMESDEIIKEEEILRFLIQVILGLHYLHKNNADHRDIKPANILLFDDSVTAKLCDFGLTKWQVNSGKTMTRVGTPDYMAPEVF